MNQALGELINKANVIEKKTSEKIEKVLEPLRIKLNELFAGAGSNGKQILSCIFHNIFILLLLL